MGLNKRELYLRVIKTHLDKLSDETLEKIYQLSIEEIYKYVEGQLNNV
jgi:hypothetical protein